MYSRSDEPFIGRENLFLGDFRHETSRDPSTGGEDRPLLVVPCPWEMIGKMIVHLGTGRARFQNDGFLSPSPTNNLPTSLISTKTRGSQTPEAFWVLTSSNQNYP